ncbi:MAG: hypothetical protein GEU93_16325 [Propionibacteriales bacterium]|nr:hypothetical protein [Propionibacteriales bacterium]
MSPGGTVAAYRLIQEALTNTVKHAGPEPRIQVRIEHRAEATTVTVEDDGGRSRPDADGRNEPVPGTGVGLNGVRERAHAAGGTFCAGPTEDGGFRVRAEFPVHEPGGER